MNVRGSSCQPLERVDRALAIVTPREPVESRVLEGLNSELERDV